MAAHIKKNRETTPNVLLTLASVVVVFAGLKMAAEIFVPIAIGLFLGVLSMPILNFLDYKLRLPRPIAVLLTVLVDLLILGSIVYVVSGIIPEVQEKGPEYAEKLKTQLSHYSEMIDGELRRFERFGSFFGFESNPDSIPTFKDLFLRYWETDRVVALISQTELVERMTSLASKSFFALILMVFVLAESQRYAENVLRVIEARGPDLRRFQNSGKDLQNYLLLKTAVSLLTGILAWIVCKVAKIEFALLWGIVAFLLNYIPVIGSIIAALPPVALALILQDGFWPAAIVLFAYLAINMVVGNFLEPKLLGDSFGISTIVVILSVLFWGYIWGAAGMFLAVPLTMLIKVMLDNTSDLRWISVMVSRGADFEDEVKPSGRPNSKEGTKA